MRRCRPSKDCWRRTGAARYCAALPALAGQLASAKPPAQPGSDRRGLLRPVKGKCQSNGKPREFAFAYLEHKENQRKRAGKQAGFRRAEIRVHPCPSVVKDSAVQVSRTIL